MDFESRFNTDPDPRKMRTGSGKDLPSESGVDGNGGLQECKFEPYASAGEGLREKNPPRGRDVKPTPTGKISGD
jgi:hypothetical protein